MLAQFIPWLLDPFGRSQQPGLLAVPRAVDDGALRASSPASIKLAQHARLPSMGDQAGDRIIGAVHPCVVMVAAQSPIARASAPGIVAMTS